MRKIEEKMLRAFENGKNFCESNTQVVSRNGVVSVYLFGNKIAEKKNGKITYDTCGWNTNTTNSRLRALGANCRIKNGVIIFG